MTPEILVRMCKTAAENCTMTGCLCKMQHPLNLTEWVDMNPVFLHFSIIFIESSLLLIERITKDRKCYLLILSIITIVCLGNKDLKYIPVNVRPLLILPMFGPTQGWTDRFI